MFIIIVWCLFLWQQRLVLVSALCMSERSVSMTMYGLQAHDDDGHHRIPVLRLCTLQIWYCRSVTGCRRCCGFD